MRRRVGWLIWLVLIAGSLPAMAAPTPVKPENESAASTPKQQDPDQNDAPAKPCLTTQADLWDGGLRAGGGSRSPSVMGVVLLASLLGYEVSSPLIAPEPEPLGWVVDSGAIPSGFQTCWLQCRYAHAPPRI